MSQSGKTDLMSQLKNIFWSLYFNYFVWLLFHLLFSLSVPLPSVWAEDSVWDVHQPPAGQNPSRDGRPWEDRGQRDGWPDHGGWPGRPWVPAPQDAVLPIYQSGSLWSVLQCLRRRKIGSCSRASWNMGMMAMMISRGVDSSWPCVRITSWPGLMDYTRKSSKEGTKR